MRKVLVLLLAFAATPAMAQAQFIPPDIGADVASAYVEPTLAGFLDTAATLTAKVDALCAAPAAPALADARTAFGALITAWGRVSVLRFGPLVTDNRFESIFFWPDTRGVTLKQVQAALAGKDESVTDAATLAEKSVALHNLLAVEFLLAGSDADTLASPGDAHRCAYLAAASRVLATKAQAVADGWAADAPIGMSFRAPGGEGYFRSADEVTAELLKTLRTGSEYLVSAELLPALGDTIDDAHGRRAPLWRSDLTFALAKAQLDGMIALLEATGLDQTLTGANLSPYTNLHTDLEQAGRALAAIDQPAETAFADPASRKKLDYARLMLGYAETTISDELVAALGLTMGFNALDGD